MSTWVVAALLLWAVIVMYRGRREARGGVRGPEPRAPVGTPRQDDDVDYRELEAAEREVRDLETDVRGRPLDDQLGDDWGPGTPKPPYL